MNAIQENMLNPVWPLLLLGLIGMIANAAVQLIKGRVATFTPQVALRSSIWLVVIIVTCVFLFL